MKHSVPAQTENDLIDFYRNAIRTRSYSNQEGDIAVLILKEMESSVTMNAISTELATL